MSVSAIRSVKVLLVAVGKPRAPLAAAIAEYESRLPRYFGFGAAEVKAEPTQDERAAERTLKAEGERLLARVPPELEIVALDRRGEPWSSEQLAGYLGELGQRGARGAAFLVGGAYGLSEQVLSAARHRLSLSALTLPHELARLVLAEQLYRAGTILRGEPYHKTASPKRDPRAPDA